MFYVLMEFLVADPGDRVEVDEPIAQIETDKVTYSFKQIMRFLQRRFEFNICDLMLNSDVFLQVTIDIASPEAGVIQKVKRLQGVWIFLYIAVRFGV